MSAPGLTPDQAVDVRLAREALAASEADKSLGSDLKHRAKLEYHTGQLLELVAELTGGRAGEQLATMLSALADAEKLRLREGLAFCHACQEHPAGLCDDHAADLDAAAAYSDMAAQLGGAEED